MKNSKSRLQKIKSRTILTFENNKTANRTNPTGYPDTTTTTFPTSTIIFGGLGKR